MSTAWTLAQRYAAVRARTVALAAPLSEADCQAQAMPDASPTQWHLAHVTWFFETFVLERWETGFQPHHPAFRVLFNSYYNGVGEQHPRAQRGLITRPSLAEVLAYRAAVDARMAQLLATTTDADLHALVELGLHHEQQHQELILTDLLYLLSCNPLAPAYQPPLATRAHRAARRAGRVELRELRRRPGRDRPPRRRRLCLRQRNPASQDLAAALRAGAAAGQPGRVGRIHRQRRLPRAALVAVGRLGLGAQPARRRTALLASTSRRRLAALHAARPAAAGRARAGRPHQLLRGRRLRPLAVGPGRGGRWPAAAPAHRGRMGARRAGASSGVLRERTLPGGRRLAAPARHLHARRPAATAGRRLGVDRPAAYAAVSGFSGLGTATVGEYNAKFMVNQIRAARRLLRHAAQPHPHELPQLLPGRHALAVFNGVRLARDDGSGLPAHRAFRPKQRHGGAAARRRLLFNYDWDALGLCAPGGPLRGSTRPVSTSSPFPSNARLIGFDLERFARRPGPSRAASASAGQAVLSHHEQFGALAAAHGGRATRSARRTHPRPSWRRSTSCTLDACWPSVCARGQRALRASWTAAYGDAIPDGLALPDAS